MKAIITENSQADRKACDIQGAHEVRENALTLKRWKEYQKTGDIVSNEAMIGWLESWGKTLPVWKWLSVYFFIVIYLRI